MNMCKGEKLINISRYCEIAVDKKYHVVKPHHPDEST